LLRRLKNRLYAKAFVICRDFPQQIPINSVFQEAKL
jgi:hypothetical protein